MVVDQKYTGFLYLFYYQPTHLTLGFVLINFPWILWNVSGRKFEKKEECYDYSSIIISIVFSWLIALDGYRGI